MKGLGTSPGIGIGKIFLYKEIKLPVKEKIIENANLEIERFYNSIKQTKEEISKLYKRTLINIGEKEAEIFLAHKMILEDPEFIKGVVEKIKRNNLNSEWAVKETISRFIDFFENKEEEYFMTRAVDLKDVSDRVLRSLLNIESIDLLSIGHKAIIVSKDLTPSDTISMNKDRIVGFVTENGGRTSHTSIIAKTLEIPAIVGIKDITEKVNHGDLAIIDGEIGHIILNPTKNELKSYKEKIEEQVRLKETLKHMIGKESLSKDNFKVKLLGNIGIPSDIDKVLEKDGEGVGLFRSEFLYMGNSSLPSEDKQFEAYKEVAIKLKNKPLIIRTLDVGGDKEIHYLKLPKETNPSLGYRAIRVSLNKPEILKTQIRAIYRASHYGNIKILFPMVSSIEELRYAKEIASEVRNELIAEKIEFSEKIEIGIMVEVPSVAIHARAFAKEVDFFSIGTNDLIQYTIAVDRGNQNISKLYSQYHPSILRLVKMTIDAGHEAGISVGVCGEVAGDKKLIPVLLGMGLDEFSMNPGSILKARYQIRNTSKEEMKKHIDTIINLPTAIDVENYIDRNILK